MNLYYRIIKRLQCEVKNENSKLLKKGITIDVTPGDMNSDSINAEEIVDDVYDMVIKSYEKIGGNTFVKSKDDLLSGYKRWKVADVDEDPEPDVFIGGNDAYFGGKKKLSISATDGSAAAKAYYTNLKGELFRNGWWAEVSEAPAHIALNKLGIKPLEDEEKVRYLLGGMNIEWHGEHPDDPEGRFKNYKGWYTRKAGSKTITKIIVGDF